MKAVCNSILELIEETARLYPNNIAINDQNNQSITYKNLLKEAKEKALFFVEHNMHKMPVGVLANQSINSIVTFLAVLQSGNFYIPIAEDTPNERLTAMLDNAFLNVATGKCFVVDANNLDVYTYANSALTKADNLGTFKASSNLILPDVKCTDLMYVVYTSGSTGVPKGVAKSHLGLMSFVSSFVSQFNITSDEVFGNQTPFYFDASSKDIYVSLCTGATLQLIPKSYFGFPLQLIKFLNQTKVTSIMWVPSALAIVAQLKALNVEIPEHVKKVFFVGETFPIKHLNSWVSHLPNASFYNLYGASETAGVVCYYRVLHEMPEDSFLPIGKPLSGADVFLLDEDNNIIASTTQNQQGEICVSGTFLASGYFNDLAKTQQVFVQNPGNQSYLSTIYKTGDIGVYDHDGNIVYVCRKDFQIKHMGHRIELMDIESAFLTLQEIGECCCCYDQAKKRIVLFYTLCEEGEDLEKQIKEQIKNKLPEYMLPSRYIKYDILPKNKSGKIDRNGLKNSL